MNRRAVILTRVSSEGQEDNTSTDEQARDCLAYCERRGWEVVASLEEVESGAMYGARLEMQAAIEMIEAGQADRLVMYDISRYGRDTEYQHKFLKRIVRAGGQLKLTTFELEYDPDTGELTPESEQMFTILGSTGVAEKRHIRRRLQRGINKRIKEGVQVARRFSPYGFHCVSSHDVIRNPELAPLEGLYQATPELPLIHPEIFARYLLPGGSFVSIARHLTNLGIPTPGEAETWIPTTVRKILRNPIYMGRPVYGLRQIKQLDEKTAGRRKKTKTRELSLNEWRFLDSPAMRACFDSDSIRPHLVPESVWMACWEKMQTNREAMSGRGDRTYPLRGLIQCPHCSCKASGNASAGLRHYVCLKKKREYQQGRGLNCPVPAINAVLMERIVYDVLAGYASDAAAASLSEAVRKSATSTVSTKQTAALKAKRDRLERLPAIIEKAVSSKIEKEVEGSPEAEHYANAVKGFMAERDRLESEVRELASVPEVPVKPSAPVIPSQDIISALLDPEVSNRDKNLLALDYVVSILPLFHQGKRRRVPLRGAVVTLRYTSSYHAQYRVDLGDKDCSPSVSLSLLPLDGRPEIPISTASIAV